MTDPKIEVASISSQAVHMWQAQVEIEHYFVACFDRIAAFEAL